MTRFQKEAPYKTSAYTVIMSPKKPLSVNSDSHPRVISYFFYPECPWMNQIEKNLRVSRERRIEEGFWKKRQSSNAFDFSIIYFNQFYLKSQVTVDDWQKVTYRQGQMNKDSIEIDTHRFKEFCTLPSSIHCMERDSWFIPSLQHLLLHCFF